MTCPTDATWPQVIADWLLQFLWTNKPETPVVHLIYERGDYDAAMLLQRLGYAVMANDHVKRLETPLDTPFPTRWDDAALVAMRTMKKRNLIRYPDVKGTVIEAFRESYDVPPTDPLSTGRPGAAWQIIGQTPQCAQAKAKPEACDILKCLGLVSDAAWTEQAVPVVWRLWANMHPADWLSETDRFKAQLQHCSDTMPTKIAEQIEALLTFSDTLLERKAALLGDWADEEEINRYAGQTNIDQVGYILQTNWRFDHGWLSAEEKLACFGPSFDLLANEMAHALVTQKYPMSPLALAIEDEPDPRPMLQ